MPEDPYRYFRVEARELLDQLGQGVLELEAGAVDSATVTRLLRHAHTLKGAARVVRLPEIADRTHAVEELLMPCRDGTGPIPAGSLLALLDEINTRLAALDATPAPTEDPMPPPLPVPSVPDRPAIGMPVSSGPAQPVLLARTDAADVDGLLEAVGEVHEQLAPLRRGLAVLERASHGADLLAEQVSAPRLRRSGLIDRGSAGRIRSLATELSGELAALRHTLARTVEHTDRGLRQVRAAAERLRLTPTSSMFTALHRAVRDVATAQGKRVTFQGRGGDVRIEPALLAELHTALLHLVRNAVAHGIEDPAERRAAGKPADGAVVVEVHRLAGHVAVTCTDDGRGFDLDTVRRAARRQGLPASGDDQDIIQLLLRGGLSTAATVTEVSGRGVGLDVARDAAERLGGALAVTTEAGLGATVRLTVPLQLASLDGLIVGCGATTAVLPLNAVRNTIRGPAGSVVRTVDGARLVHDGETLAFLRLADALHLPPARDPVPRPVPGAGTGHGEPPVTAVVVTAGSDRVALGVDRLLGTGTVVVRALPDLAPASAVVGGVALDGDGQPRMVLDPDGLVTEGGRTAAMREPEPPVARHRVLVIDDSLTTRMLEQSILESAGYDVDVAASGEEGLAKARAGRHALYLVDIEMPGMDGFAFVERTRAEAGLSHTPAILVSSRASPQDRQRGVEAGACLHVEKSQFDQNTLLAAIGKLVG